MYEGMIWMLLPCFLVIVNDIFAYVFGKIFGKTKLIELSPNKTLEGFIGGMFSTFFFAFWVFYIKLYIILDFRYLLKIINLDMP